MQGTETGALFGWLKRACWVLFVFSNNIHLCIETLPSDNLSREWRRTCFVKLKDKYYQPQPLTCEAVRIRNWIPAENMPKK